MIQTRRWVTRRALIGVGLAVWILVLTLATLRARVDGVQWGVQVALDAHGRVVATGVDAMGAATDGGVRSGDEIVDVDGQSPLRMLGGPIPSTVRALTFRDPSGAVHTAEVAEASPLSLMLMGAGALLFVVLGGVVYRWSADTAVGRFFLLLSASFGSAMIVAPAAVLGYAWAGFVAATAALLAAPSMFGMFAVFPRPVRWGKRLATLSVIVALPLALAQVAQLALLYYSLPQFGTVVDGASWVWMLLNLVGALVLLTLRLGRRADRAALGPLVLGTALGVGPFVLLIAAPRLVALPPLVPVEVAVSAAVAIPLGFAYAILRHQVFGLDVLMRAALLRITGAVIGAAGFFATLAALQALGIGATESALLAVLVGGLTMPSIAQWSTARIDGWLYNSLHILRSSSAEPLEADTLEQLGQAITLRLRQVLPVHWAACIVHDESARAGTPARRILGADGQLPSWLDDASPTIQSPTAVAVAPIHRLDDSVVLLLAGPRLDGGRLDGVQVEALQRLARSVAATVEAALLRENAEDEAQFRQGLAELARDLAAAATVSEVLRELSEHAARLLRAVSASLWRPGPEGELTPLDQVDPRVATPAVCPPEVVRAILAARQPRGYERDWAAISADGIHLAFALDDGGDDPIVCVVTREQGARRFGARCELRARELTEHTTGALRRAAEREVLEEQLRHRAFYDSLTGLPNRALFLDRISHALSRGQRYAEELAVLFIDLDRFKVVNDSLGHSAGDQLLVQVGRRLRACLRESDTIARLGGDEFTVLLEGPAALEDAVYAAERILSTLRGPFLLEGRDTYVAASIGISGGEGIRHSGRDLLREADIALYRAKSAGRDRYVVFDAGMSHLPAEHLHLESDLHRALERNELRVHYQPIFSLEDGRVTGVEALVRWQHPEKGLVPPGNFIPLAEDTGLIVPIGKWVLHEACRQMREWQSRHQLAESMFVSVNLSARQLQDATLLGDVRSAVESAGLDPQRLQLEITESVVMQDPEGTVFKLNELKGLGLKLAVDDFGTGYSSLAYLKRFPIDVLKIDRAFVSGLDNGENDLAIVRTVIGLAEALGLHTTAEGIEDHAQWKRLQELGCDQGQGYVFSRPLGADAMSELLENASGVSQAVAA